MKKAALVKIKTVAEGYEKAMKIELTVQCLSSDVSGKAQKYARIGPREFVQFTEDELTIEIIKTLL